MRPAIKGMCKFESIKDGTLDLADIALMNDALDVVADNEYLVDDNFGPADAYLFVLTNWSNHIHHDLTPYTHIIALRNKVAERQSVQIAMRDEGLIP